MLTYQNLFWFYSHPAVYVIFLPFIGVLYEIVSTFAKNPPFNYKAIVYGGVFGIVGLAGEVWVHHLYVSGMVDWIRIAMMVTTLSISVPVGLMVIGLAGTLYKGKITFQTPMLYALGVMFLFLIGGLTGIPLAVTSLTVHLARSYYVVGHFHYVMAVAGTFSIFAGVYYWFPKITGRMFNEFWGKMGFWLTFIGSNIVFWTMMDIGVKGMPRRYYDYAQFPQFEEPHKLMTVGVVILAVGSLIAILNWIIGAIRGPKVGQNPWGSPSLEWTTDSPPPHGNWPSPPSVAEGWSPYAYDTKR